MERKEEKIEMSKEIEKVIVSRAILFLLLFSACAGDPGTQKTKRGFSNAEAENALGTRIVFSHQNFFTLTDPLPAGNSCAGDAKIYFHPFKLSTPYASIDESAVDPSTYVGTDTYAAAVGTSEEPWKCEDAWNENR
jgi:hypothetical protein